MLELSFSENIFLTTLSFFTSLMTSLAGAGGGTVLLAAMLQFMNPAEAIPVHGVIQFSSNLTRTWLLRKFVNWSIVIRFTILLPIGVYIGLQIFQNMDSDNIKNIIGIFILLALTLQNLKFIKSFFVPYYAFYLIGNLLKIIGFSLIGFSFYEYIDTFLMIIPATLVGSRVGQLLLNKISNKIFMIIFQIILIGLAIRLLFI